MVYSKHCFTAVCLLCGALISQGSIVQNCHPEYSHTSQRRRTSRTDTLKTMSASVLCGILHRMGPLNCGLCNCRGRSVTLLLGQAVRASGTPTPPPPSEPCYKQRRHISQAYQQLPSAARYPLPKDKQVLTRIGYYCTLCVTLVGRGHVRKTGGEKDTPKLRELYIIKGVYVS